KAKTLYYLIIFIALVSFTPFCLAARHIFIYDFMSWEYAQGYCRSHYTDLLPLTNDLEKQEFFWSVDDNHEGWIGLRWDTANQKWKWSGGTDAVSVYREILEQQPSSADAVVQGKWSSEVSDSTHAYRFFCLNLIVVQEEKTWEEALEHCRQNHGDLTSLLSKTGNLLAQREIQDPTITQRVWVGLRFLGDTWLWANGDPVEFQAWTHTGDPDQQCPVQKRCGALSKQGEWENRDCQEKLNFICI
uniref:C-type lectin domain-containing protein n=1 Tax=Oryzias sinensis TaxID=183150 RepID=A0A8C7Y034_9TELE